MKSEVLTKRTDFIFYLIGWICIGKLFRKAADYVLKPVSKEKLFLTFDELLEQIEAQKKENTIIVKSCDGI